jgi:hypothetical protein
MNSKIIKTAVLCMAFILILGLCACAPAPDGAPNDDGDDGGNQSPVTALSPFSLPENFFFSATTGEDDIAVARFLGEWCYILADEGIQHLKYFKQNGDGTYSLYVKDTDGEWQIDGETENAQALSLVETESHIEQLLRVYLATSAQKSGESVEESLDIGETEILCDKYSYYDEDDFTIYWMHPDFDLIIKQNAQISGVFSSFEMTNLNLSVSEWPEFCGAADFPQ